MKVLFDSILSSQVNETQSFMNEVFYGILAFVLIVLIICLVIIMRNYSHRVDAQKSAIKSNKKLEENLTGVNEELEQLKAEKEALSEKYHELKKLKDKLYAIAYNDRLTNLPNRQALIEMIDNTIVTLRKDEKFVLVHIDLDDFKKVNDKLGHSYGDELILDVSHRLKEAIDENDYLARYGSDEFVIFSQNIDDISEYEQKIKKMQKVFGYPFIISGREFFVTISIGIVVAPKDGKTTSLLMRNADLAMYEAKNNGKNTYCYYEESIGERYAGRLQMQSEITNAIENEEFDVVYQPVITASDKKVSMYEALLRWNHPDKGILMPKDFLSTAISTGQISKIGEIVLKKVVDTIVLKKCKVSVNMSLREFYSSDFIGMIERVSEDNKEALNNLLIEIKEETLLDNPEKAKQIIGELKSLGIGVIIDNFGISLTSLTSLNSLDVSMVKIDKSFLDAAMFEESYKILIEGIIKMCDSLGIASAVEGIEDALQMELIDEVKCKNCQGFYYGKPDIIE